MASSRVRLVVAVAAAAAALVVVEVSLLVDRVSDFFADAYAALPQTAVASAGGSASKLQVHPEAASVAVTPRDAGAASPGVSRVTARELVSAGSDATPAASAVGARTTSAEAPQRLQRCPHKLRLLASIVNASRPGRSIAAVEVNGGTRLLHIGDRIGDLTLLALRPARALLQPEQGPRCIIAVSASDDRPSNAPGQKAVSKAPPPRASTQPALSADELGRGVRRLSGNAYAVSRALLMKALASPAALRRGASFRLQKQPNQPSGIALLALPQGSPLGALGLNKGDLLSKLNGHDLTDPAAALRAFALLKKENRFSLDVVRNGAAQTITYQVD